MEKIPLSEYVLQKGQSLVAKELGVTQGAISRALLAGRNILISSDGIAVSAKEIRDFPTQKQDKNSKAKL